MEKCNTACVNKPKKIKMLKSQENGNCHEPLFQKQINERYQTFSNKLRKTKHTRSSILKFEAGLDSVATSYHVGWIKIDTEHLCLDPI